MLEEEEGELIAASRKVSVAEKNRPISVTEEKNQPISVTSSSKDKKIE